MQLSVQFCHKSWFEPCTLEPFDAQLAHYLIQSVTKWVLTVPGALLHRRVEGVGFNYTSADRRFPAGGAGAHGGDATRTAGNGERPPRANRTRGRYIMKEGGPIMAG